MRTQRERPRISLVTAGCPAVWGVEMTSEIDWSRYAVVHWTMNRLATGSTLHRGSQTRAFAGLAEAVLFASGLEGAHRQSARIDCGGKTYHAAEIERLAAGADFPDLRSLAEA